MRDGEESVDVLVVRVDAFGSGLRRFEFGLAVAFGPSSVI